MLSSPFYTLSKAQFGEFSGTMFIPEVRTEMNVSDCTIRISVGMESVSDLMTDILQALN